jgi:hypothetical protein
MYYFSEKNELGYILGDFLQTHLVALCIGHFFVQWVTFCHILVELRHYPVSSNVISSNVNWYNMIWYNMNWYNVIWYNTNFI